MNKSKLSLGNLIFSICTAVVWAIALTMCVVGVQNENQALLVLGGLSMFTLWACNIAGIVMGIVSAVKDSKDWKAWLSLGLHGGQLFITALLCVLGMSMK